MSGNNKKAKLPESELMDSFRVAANSVALLYKESLQQSRNAYNLGYEESLKDLWEFTAGHADQNSMLKNDILKFLQEKHLALTENTENANHSVAAAAHQDVEGHTEEHRQEQRHIPSPKSGNSFDLSHQSSSSGTSHFSNQPPHAILYPPPIPAIPTFNPSNMPAHLPHFPENSPQVFDAGLKRRWTGQSQSAEALNGFRPMMNLDQVEQSPKRSRTEQL